jgi:hypothetical protein
MLKALASICGIVIVGSLASGLFSQPSIASATNTITRTTSKVQQAATASSEKASALGTAIHNDAALPERLNDFARSTQRLITLSDALNADLGVYQNAAMSALKRFDTKHKGSRTRPCCKKCR